MLEFLADGGGEREDALMEMSFWVPRESQTYAGDEETPPSKASGSSAGLCRVWGLGLTIES